MDFITALLEVLIPSRAAKAETESLRLGLLRLADMPTVVPAAAYERRAPLRALVASSQ